MRYSICILIKFRHYRRKPLLFLHFHPCLTEGNKGRFVLTTAALRMLLIGLLRCSRCLRRLCRGSCGRRCRRRRCRCCRGFHGRRCSRFIGGHCGRRCRCGGRRRCGRRRRGRLGHRLGGRLGGRLHGLFAAGAQGEAQRQQQNNRKDAFHGNTSLYGVPSPSGGRWHGKAVTEEGDRKAGGRRMPPHPLPFGQHLPPEGEGLTARNSPKRPDRRADRLWRPPWPPRRRGQAERGSSG